MVDRWCLGVMCPVLYAVFGSRRLLFLFASGVCFTAPLAWPSPLQEKWCSCTKCTLTQGVTEFTFADFEDCLKVFELFRGYQFKGVFGFMGFFGTEVLV